MSRPRILDLFCGAGGAGVGYHRAGFEVIGVDINPQPRYPFEFVQADAMTYPLDGFEVVHASPPCQDHSLLASMAGTHDTGWMLDATRVRLRRSWLPYVIENVATAAMDGLMLCGASFGLGAMCEDGRRRQLRRHRLFESNVALMGPGCACDAKEKIGVYGNGGGYANRFKVDRKGYRGNKPESDEAMGIDWMVTSELSQAIPPAYTEFIGEQLLASLPSLAAWPA